MDTVKIDRKEKIKILVSALNDGQFALEVIDAIEKIDPVAAEAIPTLRKLKLSPVDAVRNAATKALTSIEASK